MYFVNKYFLLFNNKNTDILNFNFNIIQYIVYTFNIKLRQYHIIIPEINLRSLYTNSKI